MTCLSKLGAERRCNRWARTNMLFLLEISGALRAKAIQDRLQHLIGSPMQLLPLVKFPRTSIPNYLFTVVMDRFEKETLMVRIHFLQEDKFLCILSV